MFKYKEEIKISVILPVYNVCPWIDACIESLKKQKLSGLEFIFVDDCGTDNSIRKVEAWADEDERVRIIRSLHNMGSGPSRNAGIEAACGQYYSFVDPDDLVCEDFYELLYDEAVKTGCDIVKGTRVEFKDGDHVSLKDSTETASELNNRIRLMLKKNWPLYNLFTYEHQTAIYKSSLFADKDVRYGSSRVAQDVTFLLKTCYNTNSIAFQESAIYYYRQRPGAATSGYTQKRAEAQMQSLEESTAFLKTKPDFLSPFHSRYIIEKLCSTLNLYYYASRAEPISSQSQTEYQKRVRDLAQTLMSSAQIVQTMPEVAVFLDNNHSIPTAPKKGDSIFRDSLIQWTEFFKEHPQERKKTYYKGYATAILRAMLSFYKARKEVPDAFKTSLRFTKEQLYKLPLKDRCRILIFIPYCGLDAILKRKDLWIIIKRKKLIVSSKDFP